MHRRRTFALGGVTLALVLAPAAALAATPTPAPTGGGTSVTIRIEGLKKTLLLATAVRTRTGFITRFGAPPRACSAQTVQGALDVATHGKWTGKWDGHFKEYFITSILGEKPKGADFWEIFVGNRSASVGACDLKVHPGEQVLFADTNGSQNPSGVLAPRTAITGRQFTVKVVGNTGRGKPVPLRGVLVTGNGVHASMTNGQGIATLTDGHAGVLVLRASPKGYVRSEAIIHVAA